MLNHLKFKFKVKGTHKYASPRPVTRGSITFHYQGAEVLFYAHSVLDKQAAASLTAHFQAPIPANSSLPLLSLSRHTFFLCLILADLPTHPPSSIFRVLSDVCFLLVSHSLAVSPFLLSLTRPQSALPCSPLFISPLPWQLSNHSSSSEQPCQPNARRQPFCSLFSFINLVVAS